MLELVKDHPFGDIFPLSFFFFSPFFCRKGTAMLLFFVFFKFIVFFGWEERRRERGEGGKGEGARARARARAKGNGRRERRGMGWEWGVAGSHYNISCRMETGEGELDTEIIVQVYKYNICIVRYNIAKIRK